MALKVFYNNLEATEYQKNSYQIRHLILSCGWSSPYSQIMEGSTSNSKNVPKKRTSLVRIMGFRQYKVCLQCEPKSLQPACTKLSNFVPILDMSIVTTPTFIISDMQNICQKNKFTNLYGIVAKNLEFIWLEYSRNKFSIDEAEEINCKTLSQWLHP